VAWKDVVNNALGRVTGHKLVRTNDRSAPRSASARQCLPRHRARPGDTASGQPAKRRRSAVPKGFDAEVLRTIEAVRPWTMASPEKLNTLILAVRHVAKHKIRGDIVECGVWRGGSMQATART
jgi:O-methyltransferase